MKLSDFPKAETVIDVAEPDWECAPCGVSRNSDPLTCANFDALCDRFDVTDPYGKDWEIVRFAHFDVAWVEQIFVRPGSKVAAMLGDIRKQMADYPCLDEALWVQYDEDANA